ncbi:MAG: gliding motility-associated C-terminal domain-containing protein [Bacteroidales bacterium]|jgi:gliding motility-associated-like protein|nr:gliding motility-associated C-terminal domain-containing protein [Bacteroidales bacterium]
MKNTDKNYDYFRQMLQDYEQNPNTQLWDSINKRLAAKRLRYKTIFVSAILLVVAATAVFVVLYPKTMPAKQENNAVKTNKEATQPTVALNYTTTSTPQKTKESTSTAQSIVPTSINTEFKIDADNIFTNNITTNSLFNNTKPNILQTDFETNIVAQRAVATTDGNPEAAALQPKDTTKIPQLMIPNAFTPTASSNAVFKPAYKELKSYEMQIFNRKGQCLYRTTSIEQGWNGEASGKLCKDGTYIYVITFETPDGIQSVQKGSFLLSK